MNKDLVIALTGSKSRVGKALATRLRAEGHTVIPVPRNYGLLPGSDLLIHLGPGARLLAARLTSAVNLPDKILTTSAGLKGAEQLGIKVCPLKLGVLPPDQAVDLILWAVHLVEDPLCLD